MHNSIPALVIYILAAVFLLIVAVIWNIYPAWFDYVFAAVVGADILAGMIICNLNIIVKKQETDD